MVGEAQSQPWFTSKHFRRTAWILFVIVLGVWFYNGALRKHNDFLHHFRLGIGFWEGKPYLTPDRPPVFDHYPPGRLVLNAPLGIASEVAGDAAAAGRIPRGPDTVSYRLTRALCWVLAVALLLLTLRMWHRMAGPAPAGPIGFAAGAFALAVTLPWFTRDLDDAGLHLILVAMLTAAAWWTMQRRSVLAGLMLAMAATWKLTPVLFLPLMLYKRRWREAAWMVVFIVALNFIAPLIGFGWNGTVEAHRIFLAEMRKDIAAPLEDPTATGVDPPRHQNRSLKLAICRYLQTYRPDGRPHPDDVVKGKPTPPDARPHWAFVQFGDLPDRAVNLIALGVTALLGLVLAVRFRRGWGAGAAEADLAPEWAAAMMLAAILSPYCWGQHLVLCIPAALLIMRDALVRPQRLWRKIALAAAAVFILAPQKEILGKTLWTVAHSYKPQTIAVLLLLVLVLTIPRRDVPVPGEQELPADDEASARTPWGRSTGPDARARAYE